MEQGFRSNPSLLAGLIDSWEFKARHNQLPPDGSEWDIWAIFTGRGWGKTLALSQFAHASALANPGLAGCLAARTLIDVGNVIIGHPRSGLMVTQDSANPCEIKSHLRQPRIQWSNGSYAEFHSSEEPDKARGPEYAWAACDELGTWKTVRDFVGNTTFDNLQFGLRGGTHPRMCVASTPRPVESIRDLLTRANEPGRGVVLSTGTLYDNAANLPASFIARIESRYQGTRLYRQEAMGELLVDVDGAILSASKLDSLRVDEAPEMRRVVIGVDPALKSTKKSDKTGISAAGLGIDGHLYAIANRSCRLSPDGWGRRVVDTYHEFDAFAVVAEDNVLGDAIQTIIRGIDPSIRVLQRTARKKKHKRAEPILAYFERDEAHIVGVQNDLEDQLVQFTPSGYVGDHSPDDADAFVWAATDLMPIHGKANWQNLAAANVGGTG